MKRSISIFLLLVSVLLLSSCSAGTGKTKAEPDIPAFTEALLSGEAFSEKLEAVDTDIGLYLYGLTEKSESIAADNTAFYMPEGAAADELTIIWAADSETAQAVAEAVKLRIDYQKTAFESYNPGEVEKLDNAVIKTAGLYVILIVADNYDAVNAAINAHF